MGVQLIAEFDLLRSGYAGAQVTIYVAGTSVLAEVFTDVEMTEEAANPQFLTSVTAADGTVYGKFEAPLYTDVAYQLEIDGATLTGTRYPTMSSLENEDGSDATVIANGGSPARALDVRFAEIVRPQDYGTFTQSVAASTATTSLQAAISAASGLGGGTVKIPAGTYTVNKLTLPGAVRLEGEGRGVTVLQCTVGDNVVTVTGDKASIADLTLDGVSLVASSVGLRAKAINHLRLENCEIRRFEKQMDIRGGTGHRYRNLFVEDGICAQLWGDNDVSGGGSGAQLYDLLWEGGRVYASDTIGVDLKVVDLGVRLIVLRNVEFTDNNGASGIGLKITGGANLVFDTCRFTGNTKHVTLQDNSDQTIADDTVLNVSFPNCRFNAASILFNGNCENVTLSKCLFEGAFIFNCTTPNNPIVLIDPFESASVTTSGDGTKVQRIYSVGDGTISGQTTNNTATAAWKLAMGDGEVMLVTADIVGQMQNGIKYAAYKIARSFVRGVATLAYDGQTGNFTVGLRVTGATTGATGIIVADADSGATGTLSLVNTVGTFQDNEAITDTSTGAAVVNGTITRGSVTALGSTTQLIAAQESSGATVWDADFAAASGEAKLNVTGDTSNTVDWTVRVWPTRSLL